MSLSVFKVGLLQMLRWSVFCSSLGNHMGKKKESIIPLNAANL